jgi:hypothetical protein
MSWAITIAGYRDLKGDLVALPEKLEKQVIGQMSDIAYDSLQDGAARHTKSGGTGKLFESIYNRPIQGGRQVGHDPKHAPYAKYVLYGFRPFLMVPTKKKALRWVGSDGAFWFSKGHMHPGYIGDNYLLKAKDDAISQFNEILDSALKESI